MQLLNFKAISFIDSLDKIESFNNGSIIYEDENEQFRLAVPVSDTVCAIYAWDNYDINNQERISIVEQCIQRAKILYQENIRLLVDNFPRTCVNEVYVIYYQYKGNKTFSKSYCLLVKQNGAVELYKHVTDNYWYIKIYDNEYCITNEKAARRIYEIISNDCECIIKARWY